MACPKCGCKVHYQVDLGWDDMLQEMDGPERCAACGEVFDLDDHADEDEDDGDRCERILADGKPCGLVAPCPDCGRSLIG